MLIELQAIGQVQSSRKTVFDDGWDRESAWVILDERFQAEALAGIAQFSHVEVIFVMDRVKPEQIVPGARHPRNNPDWPAVGIFAQRGKNRPNRLGLSVCRLLQVDGLRLRLEGLDAVDGSPVLDLKPWVREFGPRGPVHQPAWMDQLMQGYWA